MAITNYIKLAVFLILGVGMIRYAFTHWIYKKQVEEPKEEPVVNHTVTAPWVRNSAVGKKAKSKKQRKLALRRAKRKAKKLAYRPTKKGNK